MARALQPRGWPETSSGSGQGLPPGPAAGPLGLSRAPPRDRHNSRWRESSPPPNVPPWPRAPMRVGPGPLDAQTRRVRGAGRGQTASSPLPAPRGEPAARHPPLPGARRSRVPERQRAPRGGGCPAPGPTWEGADRRDPRQQQQQQHRQQRQQRGSECGAPHGAPALRSARGAARFQGAEETDAAEGLRGERAKPSWKTPPLAALPPPSLPPGACPPPSASPGRWRGPGLRPSPSFSASASSGSGASPPGPESARGVP